MLAVSLLAALVVTVEPGQLAMRSPAATARVVVNATPGHQVRLWVSAGSVSPLRVVGGGRFESVYTAPTSGTPTLAVVAAWDAQGTEVGSATVALAGRTEIPVETDPRAQVIVVAGGHRATARADAQGHARADVFVAPGVRTARVTAVDAAGNATVQELALDVPRPASLWLLTPGSAAPRERVRVLAVAAGGKVPRLSVSGGELERVESGPGLATTWLRATRDAEVVAVTDDGRVANRVRIVAPAPAPPPPAPPPRAPPTADEARPAPAPTAGLRRPRVRADEIGLAAETHFAPALFGAGLVVEWRHHIARSPLHLGAELGGTYGAGPLADGAEVLLGGGEARLVAEARRPLRGKVALAADLSLGGALVAERRNTAPRGRHTALDGGPSVGARLGVLVPMHGGLFGISLGYLWSPLVRAGWIDSGGAMLTVAYRWRI